MPSLCFLFLPEKLAGAFLGLVLDLFFNVMFYLACFCTPTEDKFG